MPFVTFEVQIRHGAFEETNDVRMIAEALAGDLAESDAVYSVEVTQEPNLTVKGDADGD
jgi:hypothetical protein